MAKASLRWLRSLKKQLTVQSVRGRRAEQVASDYLQTHGYVISERNIRFPVGEIDIVAREGQTLCFVEVRSTGSQQWGGPLASIGDRKRQRLIKAAGWYLHYSPIRAMEIRFDVVAIEWREGGRPTVELVKEAFTADQTP